MHTCRMDAESRGAGMEMEKENAVNPRNVLICLCVGVLALAACAPATTATVSGTIEKDGSPANFQDISLVRMLEDGDEESIEASTDNAGAFRFENVAPGKYYLLTTFTTEVSSPAANPFGGGGTGLVQPYNPQPFAQPNQSIEQMLGVNSGSSAGCSSEGGGMGVLTILGANDAGDQVAISLITNSDDPLVLKAGDKVKKDIVVFCH